MFSYSNASSTSATAIPIDFVTTPRLETELSNLITSETSELYRFKFQNKETDLGCRDLKKYMIRNCDQAVSPSDLYGL